MRKLFLALFLISLSFSLKAQTQLKGPLDAKTFTVQVTKVGKKKPLDTDELKFNLGKFKSKLFTDWGFTKATKYEATVIDSTTTPPQNYTFTVETTNDIKEVMTWEGTITGEDVDGTAEIVNAKGEKKYSFTFEGKLKGKPGKK